MLIMAAVVTSSLNACTVVVYAPVLRERSSEVQHWDVYVLPSHHEMVHKTHSPHSQYSRFSHHCLHNHNQQYRVGSHTDNGNHHGTIHRSEA